MLTRKIPSTGEALPVIGIGTYRGFDVGNGKAERAELTGVLRNLLSAGGSVLDSSPMYGRAEEVSGGLLASENARKNIFVATKVWTTGERAGIDQMNRSMKLLRADPIDLMQIHNLVDWRAHLSTLRAWKEKGRVRYVGITHYSSSAYKDLERILSTERLDFLQINYSLDDRGAARRILPLAAERGVAVLANLPFGQGRLFAKLRGKQIPQWMREAGCETWSQVLLKFVLASEAVTCVIPGTGNAGHMAENCRAGEGAVLGKSLCKELIEYWESL